MAQLRIILDVVLPLRTYTIEEVLALVAWVQKRNHRAYLSPGQPGRVVGVTTTLPDSTTFHLVGIHAAIIKNYTCPPLERVFCELDLALAGTRGIIGGDLNTARIAESQWPNCGHREFWKRIDRGRFVDCYRRHHCAERQTYFRSGAQPHHLKIQDDHLFVTSLLGTGERIRACEVVDNPEVRKLSDHIPVIAELDLG